MLVLRLLGFMVLITVAVSIGLYSFTRNRRYLNFAWRVFIGALLCVAAVAVFIVLERLLGAV